MAGEAVSSKECGNSSALLPLRIMFEYGRQLYIILNKVGRAEVIIQVNVVVSQAQ